MLKRSARFAVAADGTVTIPRRPVVRLCHVIGAAIEYLDCLLDAIPTYSYPIVGERRRWHRYGNWGCPMRMHRIWVPLVTAGDQ
jgi:hypothetical protein